MSSLKNKRLSNKQSLLNMKMQLTRRASSRKCRRIRTTWKLSNWNLKLNGLHMIINCYMKSSQVSWRAPTRMRSQSLRRRKSSWAKKSRSTVDAQIGLRWRTGGLLARFTPAWPGTITSRSPHSQFQKLNRVPGPTCHLRHLKNNTVRTYSRTATGMSTSGTCSMSSYKLLKAHRIYSPANKVG